MATITRRHGATTLSLLLLLGICLVATRSWADDPLVTKQAEKVGGVITDLRIGVNTDGAYQEIDLGYQFGFGLGVVVQLHNMLVLNTALADEFDHNSLSARLGLRFVLLKSERFRSYAQATYGVGVVTGWQSQDSSRIAWMGPLFHSISTSAAVEYRIYNSESRALWVSINGGANMLMHSGLFRTLPGGALGFSLIW